MREIDTDPRKSIFNITNFINNRFTISEKTFTFLIISNPILETIYKMK